MYIDSIIKPLDLYGQSTKFSYKNRNYFSTNYSLTITLLIYIIIIIYFICLIIETTSRKKFYYFSSIDNIENNNLLSYNIVNDYNSLFDLNSETIDIYNKTFLSTQISVGFKNNYLKKMITINPKYLYLSIESLGPNNEKNPVLFDMCRRFYSHSRSDFELYGLNSTYCIFSPFDLKGDYFNNFNDNKNLVIQAKKCVNNTFYYVPKSYHPDYIYLYLKYNEIKSNGKKSNIFCMNKDSCFKKYDIPIIDKCNNKNFSDDEIFDLNENKNNKRLLELSNKQKILVNNLQNYKKKLSTIYNKNYHNKSRNLQEFENENNITNYLHESIHIFNKNQALCYMEQYTLILEKINEKLNTLYLSNYKLDSNYINNLTNNTIYLNNAYIGNSKYNTLRMLQSLIPDDSKKLELVPVICSTKEDIEEYVNYIDININFSNKEINLTSYEDPIQDNIHRIDIYKSNWISTAVIYYSVNSITSYNSLIPKIALREKSPTYSLGISGNNILYEESDDSDTIYKIILNTDNKITKYIRAYNDILNIVGLVGGLLIVLISIGYIMVKWYNSFRYDESIINEFYSLITKKDIDKVNKLSFEDFLYELREKFIKIKKKREFNVLELFFNEQKLSTLIKFNEELQEFNTYEERKRMQLIENKNSEELNKNIKIKDNINLSVNKNINTLSDIDCDYSSINNSSIKNEEKTYQKISKNNIVKIDVYSKNNSGTKSSFFSQDNSNSIIEEDSFKLNESLMKHKTFLKYKIIYELFKKEAVSGIKFTFLEIFIYTFFRCFSFGYLNKKFITYKKAVRYLNYNNYTSIVNSLSDFELIKKALFNYDQLNLFESVAKESIGVNVANLKENIVNEVYNTIGKELNKKIKKNIVNKEKTKERIKINELKMKEDREKEIKSINLCKNEKLLKRIKKLDVSLEELASSDREDDENDVKLISQLNVNKELIEEFLLKINESRKKKNNKNSSIINNSKVHDNSFIENNEEKLLNQAVKKFQTKY